MRNRFTIRRLSGGPWRPVLCLAAALSASGCDKNGGADVNRGKSLFTARCSTCHLLAAAGAGRDPGAEPGRRLPRGAQAGHGPRHDRRRRQGAGREPAADGPTPPSRCPPTSRGPGPERHRGLRGQVAGTGIKPPHPGPPARSSVGTCGGCHTLPRPGPPAPPARPRRGARRHERRPRSSSRIVDPNTKIARATRGRHAADLRRVDPAGRPRRPSSSTSTKRRQGHEPALRVTGGRPRPASASRSTPRA